MSVTWVWRALHGADFQLVTPIGRTYTRERYLGEIESGLLRYVAWEPGEIEVRVHAGVALLRYQAELRVDSGEG